MLNKLSVIMSNIGQLRALRTELKASDDAEEQELYQLVLSAAVKALKDYLNPVDQG